MIGYKKEHLREAESLRSKGGQKFCNLPKTVLTKSINSSGPQAALH